MGLIPIHIFSDIPWVPYGDLVAKHGFVTSIDGLPAVIDTAKSLSDDALAAREAAIISLRKSHFEWDGTSAFCVFFLCFFLILTGPFPPVWALRPLTGCSLLC